MTVDSNLQQPGFTMKRLFQRLICRLDAHQWALDTGVCARCGKICNHKVAVLDLRWRRAMCSECCSLMPPRRVSWSNRKVG